MKTNIFLISLLCFVNLVFSQTDGVNGTSIDEYNYMTKGYRIQKSSGLDMKRGYELSNIQDITKGSYSFSFNSLIRSEKNELAGILIIAYSNVSGRTYYLGMPINNPDLQPDFEGDVRSWDESMTTAYAQAVSELYSNTVLRLKMER